MFRKINPRLFAMIALALVVPTLAGCGILDNFFLPHVDPTTGIEDPSLASKIGDAASSFIPGWGTVAKVGLGGLAAIYAFFRGKNREKAIPALIMDVTQAVIAAKGGVIDYENLWNTVKDAKVLFDNRTKFFALVDHVRDAVHDALADGFQPEDLAKIVAAVEKDIEGVGNIPAPNAPAAPGA